MRAAVMYDVDDIRIEERPLPQLESGDVLVRVGASGVCSGDLMPWYVRRKAPFVFGHEPAGTVVAFGGAEPVVAAGGVRLALGARIFAHHHAPCLHCAACGAGRFVHCATWRSTSLDPGAMAEYFRVPRLNLADTLVLPAALSFANGSLVEPLACVVKSLRRAFPLAFERRGLVLADARARAARSEATLREQTLYVIGAGIMGLLHVAVGVALGARVYASDFNVERRTAAERLGAARVFTPPEARAGLGLETGGRLADAVICGPGTAIALEAAIGAAAPDGTVVMFTPLEPGERFAFAQSDAYFRDLKLVSSYSCGPRDTAEALRLIVDGVVSAARLGVQEFAFPAVERAYDAMRNAEVIKAIVCFDEIGAS